MVALLFGGSMLNVLCLIGGFVGGIFVPAAFKTVLVNGIKSLVTKVKALFAKKK